MTILLDSANLDDVRQAAELGFVRGVTTNPILMGRETTDPLAHLTGLLEKLETGDVYYQPTGVNGDLVDEGVRAWSVAPDRVVLKLPASPGGVAAAAGLVRRGARVSLTAAQTPQAIVVAGAVGCESVIAYVDRAIRDNRTETRLVAALARLRPAGVRIIAASVKNTGQFVDALCDGADAVTAPLDVLSGLLPHPAVEEAEDEFWRAAGGASCRPTR